MLCTSAGIGRHDPVDDDHNGGLRDKGRTVVPSITTMAQFRVYRQVIGANRGKVRLNDGSRSAMKYIC